MGGGSGDDGYGDGGCGPCWAALWVWATSGGFPTSVTATVEVRGRSCIRWGL